MREWQKDGNGYEKNTKWIPTGALDFKDAALPLNKLSAVHKFNSITDSAVKISPKEKKVICKNGSYGFDYLVIAVGAGKSKPEGIENTYSICGAQYKRKRSRNE